MTQFSSIQEVNSSIMFGDFDNTQLSSIIDAVKYRRAQIAKENRREIRIGSTVSFVNSRTGIKVTGEVVKIKIKNVLVKTGYTTWNVPASMLNVD